MLPESLSLTESREEDKDGYLINIKVRHLHTPSPLRALNGTGQGTRSHVQIKADEDSDAAKEQKNGNAEAIETISTKYLLACDGAHSWTRRQLGLVMEGEQTDYVWGVIDIIPLTDLPDIRTACAIHSSTAGSILNIPREERISRLYIQLGLEDNSNNRIGQRISPNFSVSNRIFLAGDAVHTHSPKLGQGMNVSMQDAYNIGWKLGAVLTGTAKPSILSTYETERRQVALELLNADRDVARFYARKINENPPTSVPKNGTEPDTTTTTTPAPPSPSSTFPSFFRGPWDEELGWDYDRIFVDERAAHDKECGFVYQRLGIANERGCLVGVRPDQHVGWVGGLGDVEGLGGWLGGFLVESE